MHTRILCPLFVAASLLALAACQPSADKGAIAQGIDQAQKGLQQASTKMEEVKQEISQAQNKLALDNLTLSDSTNKLPKAELTPEGALLIDGKPVAMTAEQKTLAQAYRSQLQGVASEGVAIGMAGAKLGIDAAAGALKGLLGGQASEEIEKQAGAAVQQTIKPKVQQLCAHLPDLLKTQKAWAAVQPEFRPYATMNQADVDDCINKDTFNF